MLVLWEKDSISVKGLGERLAIDECVVVASLTTKGKELKNKAVEVST